MREKKIFKMQELCRFLCCTVDYWSLPNGSLFPQVPCPAETIEKWLYTDPRLGRTAPDRHPTAQERCEF